MGIIALAQIALMIAIVWSVVTSLSRMARAQEEMVQQMRDVVNALRGGEKAEGWREG